MKLKIYIIALFASIAGFLFYVLYIDDTYTKAVNDRLQWANATLLLDWKAERNLLKECEKHRAK